MGVERVYLLPNIDGRHMALVAAKNQEEASKLMGISVHAFREYGGHRTTRPELVAIALSDRRVWYQLIHYGPAAQPWLLEKRSVNHVVS